MPSDKCMYMYMGIPIPKQTMKLCLLQLVTYITFINLLLSVTGVISRDYSVIVGYGSNHNNDSLRLKPTTTVIDSEPHISCVGSYFCIVKMLPPLYEMDDYTSCIENENIYCKIRANLRSSASDSEVWKYIEGSIKDIYKFRRDIIFRNICIPKLTTFHDESIKKYSELLINNELEHFNLSSSVDVVACTDGSSSKTSFDFIILMLMILYGCLISFATFQDFRKKKGEKDDGLLRKFSLQYNWRQRIQLAKNEDNEKLRSIQGIRFYITIIILLVHTKLRFAISYVKNPSTLEELMRQPFLIFLNHMDVFWVLIFFLISSWLLTNQVCHIFRTHCEFSLKHALIMIINRYFRVVVTLAIITMSLNSSWFLFLSGPNNFDLINIHTSSCKRHWPATLLFYNNFYYLKDICIGTTWFLSADFQMYVANILILYVIYKYNLNMNKVFPLLLVIYLSIYGLTIYFYDTDIVFKSVLGNLEYGTLFTSPPFIVLYTSTFSICSSSCIGMILGALYFKNSIQRNSKWTYFLIPSFMMLPLMAVIISSFDFKRFEAALLGPLVKTMFALGFGIGILGMSQNLGGIVKKIFEWKPAVMMGNFTYCIYVCQISICFMKPVHSLPEFGILMMIQEFFMNLLYSISIGIFLTLTIEEPGIMLQRLLLPQIRKYSAHSSGKSKSN